MSEALQEMVEAEKARLEAEKQDKRIPVTGDWGCFDSYPEEIAPPIKDSERNAGRQPPTAPAALKRMQAAAHAFYLDAVAIGQHQWVEHAGLMNEHIAMLAALYESGGCIWENTPDLPPFRARYIGGKINCIFGECFRKNPEAFDAFVKAAKGEK